MVSVYSALSLLGTNWLRFLKHMIFLSGLLDYLILIVHGVLLSLQKCECPNILASD